jgi:hypothetical protein
MLMQTAIAVASGSSIYVYKNLRPSFQFTFPALEVSGVEKDIWAKAKQVFIYKFSLFFFSSIIIQHTIIN